MTIAFVQSASAHNGTDTASVPTDSNVTVGSLVVVVGTQVSSNDAGAFVSGDCTNTGTATLQAIDFDANVYLNAGEGFQKVGIWSAIVTATGSLTIQVSDAGATSNPATAVHVGEFSGQWSNFRQEDSSTSSNGADGDTAAETGTATSVNGALFIGGLVTYGVASTAITEGGDFTLLEETNATGGGGNSDVNSCYRITTSGLTDELTWTLGAGNLGWSAALGVYRESIIPVGAGTLTSNGQAPTPSLSQNLFIKVPTGPLR